MQTLGIADSTPRSESRVKSLIWPEIMSGADVDYLGAQGYWVCAAVAVFSLLGCIATRHVVAGVFVLLFYFLGGVGVRERSRYAAASVFAMFVLDIVAGGVSVLRLFLGALLLSNLRATWIASSWKPDSEEAVLPPRMGVTLGDKFADRFPMWLWPKVRVVYYIYSGVFLVLVAAGLAVSILQRLH